MASILPPLFLERLQHIFPEEKYAALLETFRQEKAVCFRVNTLKTSEQDLLPQLEALGLSISKHEFFENTYTIPAEQKNLLTYSEFFTNGLCYVQNLSSMLPVFLLAPTSADKVLDIAAAPGSKTTQIAASMNNEGWISAVEINKSRFFKLKDNLALQGITNVHTYLMDGSIVWQKCPEEFDKILVDAPCSSESRFNENEPETFAYWSDKKIREMVKKQKRLIFSAFLSLKPGGSMVYATCSFAPEENEQILNYLLRKFSGNAVLEAIELPLDNIQHGLTEWKGKKLDSSIKNAIRILPNGIMDGFFVCKIRKQHSTKQK
ncbi:MAG: RsmB/NOP family class I SAM-dependent RNA methyltransferase [Gammaproteobacteria bacterium]|nr:RsmB/NOP family class I SAM-dependent RNA methyltransferase [Gammaproteobacteria bacterium]